MALKRLFSEEMLQLSSTWPLELHTTSTYGVDLPSYNLTK